MLRDHENVCCVKPSSRWQPSQDRDRRVDGVPADIVIVAGEAEVIVAGEADARNKGNKIRAKHHAISFVSSSLFRLSICK